MAEVNTTHYQVVNQSSMQDLVISKLEFIRLTATSGKASIYVTAETEGGNKGIYGPIDADAALLADKLLVKKVLGRNALEHEAIWNDLFGSNRHSRGSHYLMGMSTIDNLLWDLKGQIFGQPVYKILGGNRKQVRVYGSCLGFSQEPEKMQAKARELKAEGYTHQKWFLNKTSPQDGPAVMAENVEKVRLLREALGDEADLMIDVLFNWDLPYAAAWAKHVEKYNLRWFEEPVPTANLDAFIELSRETSVPIATGEHFYGRWDVQKFLKEDAIRVVQADPEWCGGVSELVKICAIASVHGAHVIPHGHSIHAAMHVVASQSPDVCPLVEYLIGKMDGNYYHFEKNAPRPINGKLTLPDRSGFGIELDSSKINKREIITWRDL
ncbi:TPA: mandelate racemase [Candidatus Poribacteria bacterium]|nr:mandelate racemase [Candidatus Poribacteria bacterium]